MLLGPREEEEGIEGGKRELRISAWEGSRRVVSMLSGLRSRLSVSLVVFDTAAFDVRRSSQLRFSSFNLRRCELFGTNNRFAEMVDEPCQFCFELLQFRRILNVARIWLLDYNSRRRCIFLQNRSVSGDANAYSGQFTYPIKPVTQSTITAEFSQ